MKLFQNKTSEWLILCHLIRIWDDVERRGTFHNLGMKLRIGYAFCLEGIVSTKEFQVPNPTDPSRPLTCLSLGGESYSEKQAAGDEGQGPYDEVA